MCNVVSKWKRYIVLMQERGRYLTWARAIQAVREMCQIWKKKIIGDGWLLTRFSHLLTSVHLLTVPVTVARVGVHADQRTTRVGLVTRRNSQRWEGWWEGGGGVSVFTQTHLYFVSRDRQTATQKHNTHTHTNTPVMELSTSLEKEASTELPWRVTEVTPPPTLRSSREPWNNAGDPIYENMLFTNFNCWLISRIFSWLTLLLYKLWKTESHFFRAQNDIFKLLLYSNL